MSYAAERWARSQTVGHSTAKAVLRELAFYHNGLTGLCCPSVSKIARVLEVKKADTITAAIRRLEEGGFISREFVRDPESGQILRTEYALIGFVASEWTHPKNQDTSPENQDTSPENWGTVPQKTRGGSPEKRGEGSPKNRDVTGKKNLELEQGKVTGDTSAPAPAGFPTFSGQPIAAEKQKKSTDRGSRLTITDLPADWKAYAEKEEPDLDVYRLWEDFRDYWTGLSGARAIKKDWAATWRQNVRSFRNAPDWKRRPMLTREAAQRPQAQTKFVLREKRQEDRVYGL